MDLEPGPDHPAALVLLWLMQEISEAKWQVGWNPGLAEELWQRTEDPGSTQGRVMRWLAESCQGWWAQRDGATFVPLAEWRAWMEEK